jgi:glycosyltransferase involved in cell wall biosynthesis
MASLFTQDTLHHTYHLSICASLCPFHLRVSGNGALRALRVSGFFALPIHSKNATANRGRKLVPVDLCARVALERLCKVRRNRQRRDAVKRSPATVLLGELHSKKTRRQHQTRCLKSLDMFLVLCGPIALWLSRSDQDHRVLVIQLAWQAIDPANAQAFFDDVVPSDRAACALLLGDKPDAGGLRVVLPKPAAELGARIDINFRIVAGGLLRGGRGGGFRRWLLGNHAGTLAPVDCAVNGRGCTRSSENRGSFPRHLAQHAYCMTAFLVCGSSPKFFEAGLKDSLRKFAHMSEHSLEGIPEARIAFLGTYTPRRCGIATFTRDLENAVNVAAGRAPAMVLAMTDPGGQHEYPESVQYEIRQAVKGDYARAAEFVNYSDVNLVSIQHEYGIYGGDDGTYVLDFLSALRVPALATLHTVLKSPSIAQRSIVQEMSRQCAGLVVMSTVAADLLERSYGVPIDCIHTIPHGIPVMPTVDRAQLKASFGVADRRMLLTFGLLGPSKGIETVIRALPRLVAECPDLVYFVVGATHPTILKRHGEAYRSSLEREAENLGVRDHVVFRDQFVSTADLCRYLQAADVFVSPYMNEAQVTSGALSYAMGAGAAAVSTPYWHARELLADGRGRLFPFGDSETLATELLTLLQSPAECRQGPSRARESRPRGCAVPYQTGCPNARKQFAGAAPRSPAQDDR